MAGATALEGGFADPGIEAAQVFRAALQAMARPGSVHRVAGARPPAPLSPAAGALALTLADHDTGLWLAASVDTGPVRDWLTFHTGAPFVPPGAAAFAFGRWEEMPLDTFPLGTPEYPDRSATLVVELDELATTASRAHRLTGPGIAREAWVSVPDPAALRANRARYPAGARPLPHLRRSPDGAAAHSTGRLMYVATKGGERAIEAAHAWLADLRRGDRAVPELSLAQIREQLALSVARVMAEGSLYDPDLAALAIKQARGDLIEAIFLIRAYRTTLPRFGATEPVATGAMACIRRISATYKDAPGGQVLGPTFDYTHRLLDFALAAEGAPPKLAPETAPPETAAPEIATAEADAAPGAAPKPHITGFLDREGLIQPEPEPESAAETGAGAAPPDLTRQPLALPAERALRLQALARGDEGFLLALGYSTQRGYARTHPFVGELRIGMVEVELDDPRARLRRRHRRDRADRVRDGEPVPRLAHRARAVHPRLWPRLRPVRAQGDRHGAGRPGAALAGARRGFRGRPRPGRRVRALPRRQHPGDGLRRAHQAAALRRLPVRAGTRPPPPPRGAGGARGC